jgi:hypothetical protein
MQTGMLNIKTPIKIGADSLQGTHGCSLRERYTSLTKQHSSDAKGGTPFASATRTGLTSASPFSCNFEFQARSKPESAFLEISKTGGQEGLTPCTTIKPFGIYPQAAAATGVDAN